MGNTLLNKDDKKGYLRNLNLFMMYLANNLLYNKGDLVLFCLYPSFLI